MTFIQYSTQQLQNTHYLIACETHTKIDHVLGHKTNLNKFRRTAVIQSVLSDHSSMKLEITRGKKTGKSSNTEKLKTHF